MEGAHTESEDDDDLIRAIVASEGKEARNLITWSVPVYDIDNEKNDRLTRKRFPGSEDRRTNPVLDGADDTEQAANQSNATQESKYYDFSESADGGDGRWDDVRHVKKRPCYSPSRRSSNSSSGLRVSSKNKDLCLRARYWSYLLDNLHRAVDEIYCTCDNDESIMECQEVIMMLTNCTRDFKSLILKIRLLKDHKAADNRHHPLAWEVRKMSPCKSASPPPSARRSPAFFQLLEPAEGCADELEERLDNYKHISENAALSAADIDSKKLHSADTDENDEEGWKVVTRGRNKSRHSRRSKQTSGSAKKKQANNENNKDAATGSPVSLSLCEQCAMAALPDTNVESRNESSKKPKLECSGSDHLYSVAENAMLLDLEGDAFDTWTDDGSVQSCLLCSRSLDVSERTDEEMLDLLARHKSELQAASRLCSKLQLEALEDGVLLSEFGRTPGKAVELHQKLSSPSRLKTRSELIKTSEERMVKAERLRIKILQERYHRLKALSERVQRVREIKHGIIANIDIHMQEKMRRAEEKRQCVLKEKVRKAQEEEVKVNEIAFINSLEAQNRKMEVMEKHQVLEARLQDIQEERQKKREEQLAKEEAALERRKVLAAERQARLDEMALRRQEQEMKWQREVQERERAREVAAEERRKERESKVMARNIALQAAADELQKKIEIKQLESSKRHELKIEEVKEKAASYARHSSMDEAVPLCFLTEKQRRCDICNIEVLSSKQLKNHTRSKLHKKRAQAEKRASGSATHETSTEATTEKRAASADSNGAAQSKLQRKKAKKLKTRIIARGKSFEDSMPVCEDKSKIGIKVQQLMEETEAKKQANLLLPAVERLVLLLKVSLLELGDSHGHSTKRHAALKSLADCVSLVVDAVESENGSANDRMVSTILDAMLGICEKNTEACWYFYHGRAVAMVTTIVGLSLKVLEDDDAMCCKNPSSIPLGLPLVAAFGVKLLSRIITGATKYRTTAVADEMTELSDACCQKAQDIVSYIVSTSLLHEISHLTRKITALDDNMSLLGDTRCLVHLVEVLASSLTNFPIALLKSSSSQSPFATFMSGSELGGIVLLMCTVIHHYSSGRPSSVPLVTRHRSLDLLLVCMDALSAMFVFNLANTQTVLCSESMFVQLRSIAAYILRLQITGGPHEKRLLDEVIVAVGYFSFSNAKNQALLRSGCAPSLLQQLCTLPFVYFSDKEKQDVLYPTLVLACLGQPENRAILLTEISSVVLHTYLQDYSDDVERQRCLTGLLRQGSWQAVRSSPWVRLPHEHVVAALEFFAS